MLELVKKEMLAKRAQVDAIMGGGAVEKTEQELDRINNAIERMREQNGRTISQSQMELERRVEQEKRDAEMANN